MIKTIEKDMFLFVLAYQNHIYNRTACSWDDIELKRLRFDTKNLARRVRAYSNETALLRR